MPPPLEKIEIPESAQSFWNGMLQKFLDLPPGFKPRAYILTEAKRDRLYKFRMVVDHDNRLFMVLSDNIRGLRPCTVEDVDGVATIHLSPDMPFVYKDLLRFTLTVYESLN